MAEALNRKLLRSAPKVAILKPADGERLTVTTERKGTVALTSGCSARTNRVSWVALPVLSVVTERTGPTNAALVASVSDSDSTCLATMLPSGSTLASTSTNMPWVRPLRPETPSNFVLLATFTWKVRRFLTRRVKLPVKLELLLVLVTVSTMPFNSSIPGPLAAVITAGTTRIEGSTWPVIWPVLGSV